jgi:hypothetical protein
LLKWSEKIFVFLMAVSYKKNVRNASNSVFHEITSKTKSRFEFSPIQNSKRLNLLFSVQVFIPGYLKISITYETFKAEHCPLLLQKVFTVEMSLVVFFQKNSPNSLGREQT